jgi:2-oxoglutarate ferredoxin oxidoreductase subunit beta
MAKLIAEAIDFPGFSFLHVMSQCITFCPEQTDWKAIVHEREEPPLVVADEAANLFLHESGFQTGLLYSESRATWPPAPATAPSETALDQLANSFRV